MRILITGKSGVGKTTLLNRLRLSFSRVSNILLDLDYFGFRNTSNKYIIPHEVISALVGLYDVIDIVCVGISSNFTQYVHMFDQVILLSGNITQEHKEAYLARELERRARQGYIPNRTIEEGLTDLLDSKSLLDFLPSNTLVLTQDEAFDFIKNNCVNLKIT